MTKRRSKYSYSTCLLVGFTNYLHTVPYMLASTVQYVCSWSFLFPMTSRLDITLGGGHGFWSQLPTQAQLARRLRARGGAEDHQDQEAGTLHRVRAGKKKSKK